LVNDCLSRGLDIDHGGARHNWVEPSFVGLANTIDALAAIDQLVFREGSLTLDALRQQLAEAHRDPALRLRLLNQCVKYGNDDDGVDQLANVIMHHVVEQCQRYETYLGGRFHPGCFCWVMHERLGSQTAASADGRLAMAALGDGSGPAQGRERRGPTAAILSATKWDHTPMLGGIAVNVRFSRSKRPADFHAGLSALIQTFMARRGFELQVNVVDSETLRQAQLRPEEYRDLVVRIGGYSDYFVGLSPRMQQELIERTEHCAL
jgi:formate C-acetyltransferase